MEKKFPLGRPAALNTPKRPDRGVRSQPPRALLPAYKKIPRWIPGVDAVVFQTDLLGQVNDYTAGPYQASPNYICAKRKWNFSGMKGKDDAKLEIHRIFRK
jgi:hypothetical protein